jgi:Cdc6-like AAA superfamily ATPase
MASVEDSGRGQVTGNPFPSLAVARARDPQLDVLTIETAAVAQVDKFVDSYLRAARTADGRDRSGEQLAGTGKICVIEGDYGTGKTHLAMELLGRVEAGTGSIDARTFYRVAPGTFFALYVGLMEHDIGQREVLARVRELYTDIVAASLRDRPFITDDLVDRLERDEIDPQLIIDGYGLKQGALLEELRRRLGDVTQDETFSRALMLLLEPDLRPLAWDWFTGGMPGAALIERGVAKPIQTDVRALEALGVIARLYGGRNRRFVLVIDEVEKLAGAWDKAANADAFSKLIEVFHAAGALLVVCGLSDVFEMLPDRSRFDMVVHPSMLSSEDLRWYIEERQHEVSERRELAPFTQASVDYIIHLTGGVARHVLRICYYAYEEAAESGREITPGDIQLVARYRAPDSDPERVRDDIAELMIEQGWLADSKRVLTDVPGEMADFWIPFGDRGGGCAVLLSVSVLTDEQAQRLANRVTAITSAGADRAVVLVIGGYLTSEQRPILTDALADGSLIVYDVRTFGRVFVTAVGAARDRIVGVAEQSGRAASAGDEFRLLREEINRVVRQQASTLRAMQELSVRTEDGLDAMERAVATLPVRSVELEEARRPLPGDLETLFGRARRSLDGYGDVRRFVDETIEVGASHPGERFPRTHQLREQDTFTRIGISAFLSDLLDGFSDSVQSWLGSLSRRRRARGGGPTAEETEVLRGICQTYEALYNVTPVHRLDPLPGATARLSDDQPQQLPSRSARRDALREAFDGLGDRVYQAAIDAGAGPSGLGVA